jgi:DNA-binding XRE family transcriptional regulator
MEFRASKCAYLQGFLGARCILPVTVLLHCSAVTPELGRLRRRAGLSQGELAERAEVSRATINRHERGETPAAVKQALRIVAALREAEGIDQAARGDATIENVYGEPQQR